MRHRSQGAHDYRGAIDAGPETCKGGRPSGLWAPERRRLTTGLLLATTFIAIEALAVLTIMPQVARELGGLNLYGWVFSAFMLGSLVGTVGAGRDADRDGPARPYLVGLALFAAGLAIAGLAPTMDVVVLGRVVQGLGAGAVLAVSYVAIGRSLPEHLRAQMMAVISSAYVVPGLLGPALSAGVAHLFGWRAVFLGLIPVVAVAGALALPALARLGRPSAEPTVEHRLLDAVLTALGAALALRAAASSSIATAAALLLVAGLAGVPALRRLLPAGTLAAGRGLPATILTRGLLTFAFFGADAFVALAITSVLHRSVGFASVAITAATLTWSAAAWLQARLIRRWEERRLIQVGLVVILGGIAWMLLCLRASDSPTEAIFAWALAGLGMGLAFAPTSLMMLREAPSGRAGWASASLNIADVLGTAMGAGLAGAAIAAAEREGWSALTGLTLAFSIAGLGAILALAVSRRLPRGGTRTLPRESIGQAP